MIPTFSLAVPHTPWIPDRAMALGALTDELFEPVYAMNGRAGHVVVEACPGGMTVFGDREPNWSWSQKLWGWGAAQTTSHFLQLQDDVKIAPNFWPALTAMVAAVPDKIIGLQGAHPKFRNLADLGHRWAVSRAWMVGVGYVIPTPLARMLVAFRVDNDELAKTMSEDEFIAHFARSFNLDIWHPLPTIIDHDTEMESTYGNDAHRYRRATSTWRQFDRKEIEQIAFWTPGGVPPVVGNPHGETCWGCEAEPGVVGFQETGVLLGRKCLSLATSQVLTQGKL